MRLRTLLILVALFSTQGCRRQEPDVVVHGPDGGDEPRSGGFGGNAGSSGFGGSGSGGMMAAGGSGGSSEPPPLPPNFMLDCGGASSGEANADPLAAWAEELDAHGSIGTDASFELQGTSYRVHGLNSASVEAPFTIRAPSGVGLLEFNGASVEGVEEQGELEIYAMQNGVFPVTGGSLDDVAIKTVVVDAGTMSAEIDVIEEPLGNFEVYRANVSASDLELDMLQQASILPEGLHGNDNRIVWMPSGPVVVTEASQISFFDDGPAAIEKPMSAPLEIEYEGFSLAGDFETASLEIDGEPVQGTATAVFGREGSVSMSAGSLASERFRITQAVNEAGLVLPAVVEIVPETAEVYVPVNGERIVRFFYREKSYTGDAVLGEIQIGGDAEELLELQASFLEDTYTAQLIGAVIDTGWAAPVVAITALPVVSVVFVIDLFDCIFGGCADLPAPLEPFPQWIDAGGMGSMEVRVKGDLVTGTYQTSLTFVGRNYCPVTVPLTVHVGMQPPVEDAGTDGGADAGDGAVGDGG